MGASTSTMRVPSISSMEASISSLFGWQIIPPENISGRPANVGSFLTVKLLEESDLPDDRGPLFVRAETVRLWDQLSEWASHGDRDDTVKSLIGLVRGAPGTGKTTTSFAWCQGYVKSTGKSVTWIHVCLDLLVYRVEFRKSNGIVYYRAFKEEDFSAVPNRIKKCSSKILVFDGFRDLPEFNEIRGQVRAWAKKKMGLRTAVIISSFTLYVMMEDDKKHTQLEVFQKMSWTRDEYIAAIQCAKREMPDSGFGEQVLKPKRRRIEAAASSISDDGTVTTEGTGASDDTGLSEEAMEDIDEQFYFAGGCARYFFVYDKTRIELKINEAVECVANANVEVLLAQGSHHPHTRHRLLSFFSDGEGGFYKRIVSQYAVERLVERCGGRAFTLLYGMVDDNPAFEGWVFEADFFFQYKRAREKNQPLILDGEALEGEEDVEIGPGNTTAFDHDTMMCKVQEEREGVKEILLRGMSMMWKPKKWNQGGYDGFYVFADPENEEESEDENEEESEEENKKSVTIWFFQVTRGASHKLNLKFFVQVVQLFLDAGLEVSGIQIYFVIPKNSDTRVSSVVPYGKLFYEKFGWVSGQEKQKIHIVRLEKTPGVFGS